MTETPEWEIRVDWAADRDFNAPRADIASRIFNRGTRVTLSRGRDQARAFSPMAGANGQFELDNGSRDYSPENLDSPLAGQVLPGREVQINADHDGAHYGVASLHLEDYKVLPDHEDRSVMITLTDAVTRLRGVKVSTPLYSGIRTGEAIKLLLDAAGWSTARLDLDPGVSVLPWWWVEDQDAGSALQALVDSEGPGCRVDVDSFGRICFRDRHHRMFYFRSQEAQATFRSGGPEPCYSDMVYDHGWKEVVNDVRFSVPVRHPSGQLATVWSMQGPQPISDGETIELSAQASTPFLGAVVPEPVIDYQLLSGTVQVSLSRTSGQATTVRVQAFGGPAVVADMSVRAYPLVTQTTVQIHAEDTASAMSPIGRRSWPSGRDPVFAHVEDARAIAALILGQRARRLPTVHITLRGGVYERLQQQLVCDLSDRVRIADTETGIDADFWIERIEHTVLDDLQTTFGCEQIPTPVDGVFTFDAAGLGFNDGRFGGTGLDDQGRIFVFDHPTQGQFDVGLFAT
jgi:hypothetical protein